MKWTSVEEALPEETHTGYSNIVKVKTISGREDVDDYDYWIETWSTHGDRVTHWRHKEARNIETT